MAQYTTQARPYAKATFELALEAGRLQDWSNMLRLLAAVVSHPSVTSYLASPSLSAEQKAKAVIDVCGEALDEQAGNFVSLLADNKRLSLLSEISRLFEELKASQERTIEVDVVSAYELSDSVEAKLAESLKKRLQREVKLNTRVDKQLIGGLVIHAGDLVIDGSLRGRLNKLADAMNS